MSLTGQLRQMCVGWDVTESALEWCENYIGVFQALRESPCKIIRQGYRKEGMFVCIGHVWEEGIILSGKGGIVRRRTKNVASFSAS